MFTRILKVALLSVLVLAFVLPCNFLFAQDEKNLDEICQWDAIENYEKKLSKEKYKELLEKCQKYYEEKSVQLEGEITKSKEEKNTLQNKIYIVKNQIKNLEFKISQTNIMIKDLSSEIKDTQLCVEKTSLEIKDSKKRLSYILREIYKEDQKPIIEILLTEEKLSDFFNNLLALEELNSRNREILENIKSLKAYLENQKQMLDEEKEELENQVIINTLQKNEEIKMKKEKEYFLKLNETEYQKYLKEREETKKRVAEISSRIFELIGVPKAPTFGEALEIANFVSSQTGIKPAFLLAVLTQESSIGRNVGQCYLKDKKTGEGIYAKIGIKAPRTMNPKCDIPCFLDICKELKRDPFNTLISCPMSFGWGGAMGPSQFIPSTWIIYKERVKQITGKSADPWNIKDAFLATGLYLKDFNGEKDEFSAAMHYFSGSSWTKYEEFYGRSVLAIAREYQKDIEAIELR